MEKLILKLYSHNYQGMSARIVAAEILRNKYWFYKINIKIGNFRFTKYNKSENNRLAKIYQQYI